MPSRRLGIRRSELIVKDVAPQTVAEGLSSYTAWRGGVDCAVADGLRSLIVVQTVTQWAKSKILCWKGTGPAAGTGDPKTCVSPIGQRDVDSARWCTRVSRRYRLDGDGDVIQRLTSVQARTLGATDEEAEIRRQGRAHRPERSRSSGARAELSKANCCRRDTPVAWRDGDNLIEGSSISAFEADGKWTVVDFKTDEELTRFANYAMQAGFYGKANGRRRRGSRRRSC